MSGLYGWGVLIGGQGRSVAIPPAPSEYHYFAANGSGDGSSDTTPALFSDANLRAALTAGKIVRMLGPSVTPAYDAAKRADEFAQDSGAVVDVEGAVIQFVPHPSNPGGPNGTFCGDRFAWLLPADPETAISFSGQVTGGVGLIIRADNVTISGINARRMGTVLNFDTDDVGHGAIIEDFTAYNVQRFINQDDGFGGTDITVNNVTVRNGDLIGYSKGAIRAMDACSGWLFQNITGDSGRQSNDSFARLIYFDYLAHHMTVTNCHGSNPHSTIGVYWNGDNFECNDGNDGITFTDCSGIGSTDGGFDCKGFNVVNTNPTASGNKRNYRVWAWKAQITGGTSIAPHNRGDTSNGSCHVFIPGYFAANRGTDPRAGFKSSQFRGYAIIRNMAFVTTGQDANTNLVLTEAGGIGHFIDCTIDGVPLTSATAGTYDADPGSWVRFHQNAGAIGCAITTSLTQTAKEGEYVSIRLLATSNAGGVYTDCHWSLDFNHPGVLDNSIQLSSWMVHNPILTFVAPAAGQSVSIDITVTDANAQELTQTMVITSTAQAATDPPVPGGPGPLAMVGTVSATTITPTLPAYVVGDICELVVHTNITATVPTVTGYTHVGTVTNSAFNTHMFTKTMGASEANPTATFDTAISNSSTQIFAAQCNLIRYARGYENFAGVAGSTSNRSKTGPTVTAAAKNRYVTNAFVINNDVTDTAISGSGWNEVSTLYDTIGADATFVRVGKVQATAAAVTGATVSWAIASSTTSQNLGLAYQPITDPA